MAHILALPTAICIFGMQLYTTVSEFGEWKGEKLGSRLRARNTNPVLHSRPKWGELLKAVGVVLAYWYKPEAGTRWYV